MVNATILFEILRDTWQTVSLVLGQIDDRLSGIVAEIFSFSWWSYITSLCFGCFFKDLKVSATIGQLSFIIQAVVAFIAVIVFRNAASVDLKYDQEQVWTAQMRGSKRKVIYISTLILTSLYLPLVRDVTKIFTCDASIVGQTMIAALDIDECYKTTHIVYLIVAVIVFFVYIIWTPILLYKVIENKKPKPKFFDETGEYKEFTDHDYEIEVEKQTKNPYKSLFEGYARKYAHYKVITMIFKIFLTLPAALIVSENELGISDDPDTIDLMRNGIIAVVLIVFALVSLFSKPYINKFENRIDGFTNIIEVSLAVVAVLLILSHSIDVLRLVLSIFVAAVDIVLMLTTIYALLRSSKWIQTRWKRLTQKVGFTLERSSDEALILFHYGDKVNFCKQRKVMVWHKFWDELIEQDTDLRIPPKEKLQKKAEKAAAKDDIDIATFIDRNYEPKHLEISYAGYGAPYLMNFSNTVGERHQENKAIIENVSMASYKIYIDELIDELNNDPNLTIMFRKITTVLQGKDVWWNGPAAVVEKIDKALNKKNAPDQLASINTVDSSSNTHFGTLGISPFPFMAKLEFDEGEIAIFSLSPIIASRKNVAHKNMMEMLNTLVTQNENKEVLRRKNMRLRFRAMSGHVCQWRIQKHKAKQISRTVQKQVYNNETQRYETKEETEYKTVNVLFTFNKGTFSLVDKGFRISLEYNDGYGSYHEAGWGDFSWSNEHYSLPGREIGINYDYAETATLQKFFAANWDPYAQMFINKMQNIKQIWYQERKNKCNEYAHRESILSYAFYYYVYNDDTIPYEFVRSALQSESNTQIRELCGRYNGYFNMLFEKYFKFINAGYHNAFWYLFWNDVWINNQDIKVIQDNPETFNPSLFFQRDIMDETKGNDDMECIALNIGTKDELVEILNGFELHAPNGCLRNGWFNDDIIDKLYDAMDELKTWNTDGDNDGDEQKYDTEKQNQLEIQIAINSGSRKKKLTDGPNCSAEEFRKKYNSASKLMQTLFNMN